MVSSRWVVLVAAAFGLLACSSAKEKPDLSVGDAAGGGEQIAKADQSIADDLLVVDAGPVSCTLGSIYPNAKVIDPDNPDWAGDGLTKAQVKAIFAKEKASNTQAYRAYKAAHTYPDLLPCAFCACGCAASVSHRSAVDCFKDLHGYS